MGKRRLGAHWGNFVGGLATINSECPPTGIFCALLEVLEEQFGSDRCTYSTRYRGDKANMHIQTRTVNYRERKTLSCLGWESNLFTAEFYSICIIIHSLYVEWIYSEVKLTLLWHTAR